MGKGRRGKEEEGKGGRGEGGKKGRGGKGGDGLREVGIGERGRQFLRIWFKFKLPLKNRALFCKSFFFVHFLEVFHCF